MTDLFDVETAVPERRPRFLFGHTAWPEWRTERLRELMAPRNLTAQQIAIELGITRNAVIGKCHRLKLPLPMRPAAAPERKRKPRLKPIWKPRPAPAVTVCAPVAGAVSMIDLTSQTCRWPLWEDDRAPRLYCGAQVITGGSYCREHSGLAYVHGSHVRERK
jgi:GcrA cell cycle regulator